VNTRPTALRTAATVLALTIALGATVAISWLAFGGTAAFRGPLRAIEASWPLIYGSQTSFAGVLGFISAPFLVRSFGHRGAVLAILAAWVGEFFALLIGGRLLANELVPETAPLFWIVGTGGPLQPIAAILGVWLRLRRRGIKGPQARTAGPQARRAEATSSRPS